MTHKKIVKKNLLWYIRDIFLAERDKYMSVYMFGQRVTVLEAEFLRLNIVGKSRLEQGKQFKAIKSIAERYNTSMQNAFIIYQNNKRQVHVLNEQSKNTDTYKLNKLGMITQKGFDSFGRTCYNDISTPINKKKSFFGIMYDFICKLLNKLY